MSLSEQMMSPGDRHYHLYNLTKPLHHKILEESLCIEAPSLGEMLCFVAAGPIAFRDEVYDWMSEQGCQYRCYRSTRGPIDAYGIWNKKVAMLFKLSWVGV